MSEKTKVLPDEKDVHDLFFKKVFGDTKCVIEFLQIKFPEKIKEKIKFSTISRKWETYIDNRYKKYLTDIIYHTELKSENDGYIVCLFEHKSSPEVSTVLQVFKYMGRVWDDLFKDRKLPIIIPVVFYHGTENWTAPQRLSQLFPGKIGWIEEAIPDFKYYLYTLDEMVKKLDTMTNPEIRLYFKALRVVNSKSRQELDQWYEKYIVELENFDQDDYWRWNNLVIMSLLYIVMKVEYGEKEEIIDIVAEKYPERSDQILTVAEKLREEGRKEGERLVARRLLELGEDIEKIKKVTDLSEKEIRKLK